MDIETMMKSFFPGHQSQAQPMADPGSREPWAPSGPPAQMGNIMNYGPAMQQGPARTMDPSMLGVTANTGEAQPQMPQFSDEGKTGADVSGFANYGMTAPALPDPNSGIMALMKMIGQPQQQQAPQAPPEGAIMQYLRSLGV